VVISPSGRAGIIEPIVAGPVGLAITERL